MAKFPQPPDQEGFTWQDGEDTISTQLQGGAPRTRLDQIGTWGRVSAQWTCNRAEYNAIRTFFKVTTVRGSLPFTIDLYIDDASALTEHDAKFVPGTMKLSKQEGETFVLQALLDVNPEPVTP